MPVRSYMQLMQAQQVPPVLWLAGDEAFLKQQLVDHGLKTCLDEHQHADVQRWTLQKKSDLDGLASWLMTPSLFTTFQCGIIALKDMRLLKALHEMLQAPYPQTGLWITLNRLTPAQRKGDVIQAIKRDHCFCEIWPLEGRDLLTWAHQLCHRKQLKLEDRQLKAAIVACDYQPQAIEQSLERLLLLTCQGRDPAQVPLGDYVMTDVKDDVWTCHDQLIAGEFHRAYPMLLAMLKQPSGALGFLSVLQQTLLQLDDLDGGSKLIPSPKSWPKKRSQLQQLGRRLGRKRWQAYLVRAHLIERQLKGHLAGAPHHELMQLCWDVSH